MLIYQLCEENDGSMSFASTFLFIVFRQAGMASGPSECATIGESSGPLSDTLQQNSNSFSQDAEGGGRGPAMTKSPSVDVDEEMCSLNIGRLRLGQSLPATLLHGRSRTPDPPVSTLTILSDTFGL